MGKTSALVNMLIPVALVVIAVLVALLIPSTRSSPTSFTFGALAVCLLGGLLVSASKFPRFSSGQWITFGPTGLPQWSRASYFAGYVLLLLGALCAIVSAALTR
jgi:phosphatidylserine synthase